jgi:hypothetical protein
MTHPIQPSPELVEQWEEQFLERPTINGCFIQSYIAAKAARWGADQELEACCAEVSWNGNKALSVELRAARRPKLPTLKEQALAILATAGGPDYPTQMTVLNTDQHILIRRALEALPQ